MTNNKKETVVVKLRRSGRDKPWGIRIAGGADLGTPIIVTRSENEELLKGDVIKKIDDYDARDVRHMDAQHLLQKSEAVKLVVERTKTQIQTKILPKSPGPQQDQDEDYETSSTTYTRYATPESFALPREHLDEVREERSHLYQPYRTTPLVLPGAKVKKDAPLGECYLRHHPNPMIRAAPHHFEAPLPEVAMKQKVVHKQFNSPIGLYSEQNIADTIKCQTSAVPIRRVPVKYDPSKSEAYKALQEEAHGDVVQEVRQPARTGVFSPHKANQSKIHQPVSKSSGAAYVNSLNDSAETIHQSGSFKRIMYSVLGQTDY